MCIDPKWTTLGFAIVDPMLPDGAADKLGLDHRPQDLDLVTLLEKSPPGDEPMARKWFEILCDCVYGRLFIYLEVTPFSHYLVGLSLGCLQQLSRTPFVPVESTGYRGDIKRFQPKRCFLGKPRSGLHSKLFAFVNFGLYGNLFLECCGTKQDPSIEDVARILLADPRRAYELADGREK